MLEIVPAHLAVQAMRDNGYKNAAYALAELIDNSIQAGATQVELLCAERSELVEQRNRTRIYQIAVLDNGCGMDAEVLKIALQFGNGTRLDPEAQTGMGRFGMGLPSASISQCTRVEVWSWQDGVDSALYTYLDVDKIRSGEQRGIPEPRRAAVPAVWYDVGEAWGTSGTLVVWSNLDRIIWRTAKAIIDNSEHIVGRMYRRFLEHGRVRIRMVTFDWDGFGSEFMSERDAQPNDPLYLMRGTSTPAPYDLEPMFAPWGDPAEIQHTIRFKGADHVVTTRFSLARPEARSGDNAGSRTFGQHAAKNIGVSVMRAGRELELNEAWAIKYDPRERWWGVEVEFPPALDELFGVTNNKQAARNFAELALVDKAELLARGTVHAALDEMADAEDPSGPLLEIAHRIKTNLDRMRAELKAQQVGERTKSKTPAVEPALQAVTKLTRERQEQGYLGQSDRDEQLDAAERTQTIENALIDAGVAPPQAQQLAAATVNDGLKYTFAAGDLDTPAFFTVKPRGGALVITLNVNHPAYEHLIGLLDNAPNAAQVPTERLRHAATALRVLLMAWARYEDEQPDVRRQHAQDMRNDWGRIARRFLGGMSDE